MNRFAETAKAVTLIKPQPDIDTGVIASPAFVAVDGYRRAVVVGQAEGPGAAKTLTVQLRQATSTGGANAKDLGTAVVVTGIGAEDLAAIAEANVENMDLANGFKFIGATLKTNKGSAVDGAALLILDRGRYSE